MTYCPICQAPTRLTERRPNGNSTCANGHTYPSAEALTQINAKEYPATEGEEYMTD